MFPALIVTAFLLVVSKGFLKILIGRKNILLLICVILSTAKEIVKQREDMKVPLWGISVFIWLRGMFFLGEFLAIGWGWIR